MTRQQALRLAAEAVSWVLVIWVLTPESTKRLWAMKATWWAHQRAARWATTVAAAEMRSEAAGRPAVYQLPFVLSVARDRLAGVYEQLRDS